MMMMMSLDHDFPRIDFTRWGCPQTDLAPQRRRVSTHSQPTCHLQKRNKTRHTS